MSNQPEGRYVVGNVSLHDRIVGVWGEDQNDGRYMPQRFDSEAEAQAEINEVVTDSKIEHLAGNLTSAFDADDFKVLDSTDPIIAAMLLEEFPDLAQDAPSISAEDQPTL
ncbi:hypothetical protein [Acetobacter malorum]|nr:hypothetical protein [Acetobacter malorum]KXV06776.1 hypothetical protein AD930_06670 [Acetobacter malorum]